MAKPKAQTLQQRFGFLDDDLKTPKHDEIMLWLDENCINIIESLFWSSEWNEENVKDWINRTNTAISYGKQDAEKNIIKSREYLEKGGSGWLGEKEKEILESYEEWLVRLNKWANLGTPPPKQNLEQSIRETVWEKPVTSNNYKSTYTIGFIDFVCYYQDYSLFVKNLVSEHDGLPWAIDKLCLPKWEIRRPDNHKVCFEVKSTIPSLGELIRQVQMYRQYTGGDFVIICPDDRLAIPLKKQNIHFYKYPF